MGFNFFKAIGAGFKKIDKSIGLSKGFKKVTHGISEAAKTVYHKVLTPVYNKVLKPVANTAMEMAHKSYQRMERFADAGANAAEGVGKGAQGLGSFLSNPLGVIAAGAGIIVMASIVKG